MFHGRKMSLNTNFKNNEAYYRSVPELEKPFHRLKGLILRWKKTPVIKNSND